jgi:signal transduction histidine kinase
LDAAGGTKSFDGIVYAGIGFDKIGNYLETQLSPELAGSLTLIDKGGNIVYSKDQSILGENVLGDEFQNGHLTSVILSNEKWKFDDLINRSLNGESGSTDMSIFGATNTISYDPVTVDGQIFGAIYISTPHSFASTVIALVNEQRNTSIVVIIAIGIAAAALSVTVLLWNKRLDQMIRKKTQELANRSVELEVVNNELKAANDKLAALDEIRTEFINTAAHELRNPVQPIISYAKLALDGSVDKVTALNVIDEQARRLKQLASDVLSANRMESGNFTLETEIFPLADFLHKTVQTARTWIPFERRSLLSIRAEIDENVMLTGDVNRLTLVLTNLITNALKFTHQGEIVLSARKIDVRTVQIRISDTGKGIPEHMLPKLFGKFITSSSGRENPQGIGLGLYISRKIVEAHGGQIWAENNGSERSGATVILNLPLRNP